MRRLTSYEKWLLTTDVEAETPLELEQALWARMREAREEIEREEADR
ncbi:MAG TPA: hypothetical protein VIG24_02345 [Acidimicrobiia bacterium]